MLKYLSEPARLSFETTVRDAEKQKRIALHSPGALTHKTVSGESYAYWRVYQIDGKRTEEYLGRHDDTGTLIQLEERQALAERMRNLAAQSKALREEGYCVSDNSTALTLATLFNAGAFEQGAVLVGSSATYAALNQLGIKVPARLRSPGWNALASVVLALPENPSFSETLLKTGLPFVDTPSEPSSPATASRRSRGSFLPLEVLLDSDQLLRLPDGSSAGRGIPSDELLWLTSSTEKAIILGRDHLVPVRMPNPVRLCLRNLLWSHWHAGHALRSPECLVLLEALLDRNEAEVSRELAALRTMPNAQVNNAARFLLLGRSHLPKKSLKWMESILPTPAFQPA